MERHGSLALDPSAGDRRVPGWVVPAPTRSLRPARRSAEARERADRDDLKRAVLDARSALGDAAIAATVAAQRAFAYAEKLDEALAALQRSEQAPASILPASQTASARMGGDLTPREREVLALVAEGRSNKAIAEALLVSPNTVKTHVASLLNKLHADSRAQLAAMAVRGAIA